LAALFNKFIVGSFVCFLGWQACTPKKEVTFAEDIAPIIHSQCTPCHRENGGGPFPLVSFQDVAKRSKMVAHVTKIRYMPPWPADPQYSRFVNERLLSKKEIDLIQTWYKNGSKPGDTTGFEAKAATLTASLEKKPDIIVPLVAMPLKGNHRDRFFVVKAPLTLPEKAYVRMIEFVPGIASAVHHVNGHLLNYPDNYPIDIFSGNFVADIESDTFEQAFKALNLYTEKELLPERIHSAVNYLPGVSGVFYPNGIGGFTLAKRSIFVLKDIHYGPVDKDKVDRSALHIYLSKTPPERPIKETMLGTNGISAIVPPLVIAPNKVQTFRTQAFLTEDISLLTINPHMHLLGKSLKAFAVKPNGDTLPLIHIPEWNFRWQYFYTFKHMLKIPKGSTIFVEAVFDNTSKNPNNPNKPPQTVGERLHLGGASMRTTDEMLQFILSYLPYKEGDEKISLQ